MLLRVFGWSAVIAIGLSWPGAALAEVTVTPAAKGYDVDVTGQASTTEVLEAIVGATGVEIKGTPGDAAVSENHLRGASLERAIRALLPKAGFIVRSDAEGKPAAIIFMAVSDDGSRPPGIEAAPPAMPDGSAPLDTADAPLPDGMAPEAPAQDSVAPEMPLPDGSAEPAQDPLPSGTQGEAPGG